MKYEIGQKVETPLGVGVVVGYNDTYDMYLVDLNDEFTNQQFKEYHLKPYMTPHEKLIELGYEVIQGANLKMYRHDKLMGFRVYDDNTISCIEIDLELAKIIKEYLEWLEEGSNA